MVAPPSEQNNQSSRVIRDWRGYVITTNESLARIELLRSIPPPSFENERPSNRELLDYMNFEAEAEDLEYRIN